MGRIIRDMEVDGKHLTTLFDTGSDITYITEKALPEDAKCEEIAKPITSHVASEKHTITKSCIIPVKIENQQFPIQAFVVGSIGGGRKIPEAKKEIDILFGAIMMETWDIKLDPKKKKLDVTGLKKREFISF